MSKIIIIGAGGVGAVVAKKCAQLYGVFSEIILASRTESKCKAIGVDIKQLNLAVEIRTAQVDADNVTKLVRLFDKEQPFLVINVALPYQDLTIMDACLEVGVHYVDTANYEPKDTAKFEYHWQWAYQERFKEKGLMALLGSGFDPGVTNAFTAYAAKHYFDEIQELNIVDVNGGDHGHPFATNFNPEVNIREVSALCRHWEGGNFVEAPAMSDSRRFSCPQNVGEYNIYKMYHEELESLTKHYPSLKKAQFWMSFSDNYINHLQVLKNIGMTRIDAVDYNGVPVVPLEFLKCLLPDPSTLGPKTKGKTCIGCIVTGIKDGETKHLYIYNISDHQECYREVGSQAISYTTGVPAMIGAKMLIEREWLTPGVWNIEQLNPDKFMEDLNHYGLPWQVKFLESNPFSQ